MAVAANNVAFPDLLLDAQPLPVTNRPRDVEALVDEMVEIKYDDVSFSAIHTLLSF